jgi:PKD repeat protein
MPALCALVLGCLLYLALAVPSLAAANWLDPVDLSKPGRNASNPTVAMDAAGNTAAMWERQTLGPGINMQISNRPVGGAFADPLDFQPIEGNPQLATTQGGEAVAIWRYLENPPGNHVIQVSTRPPGGSFSPPFTIHTSSPSVIPQEPRVAIGAGGDVAVTWSQADPDSGFDKFNCRIDPETSQPIKCTNPSIVMAAVRPAGGTFTTPQRISALPAPKPEGEPAQEEWAKEESVKTAGGARPVVDPAGNTTVVWSAFNGANFVIQTATRPAGGDFTPPVQVSESGENAGGASIGVDSAGNAIAAWASSEGTDRRIQAALKPAGGSFGFLGDVSPAGATAVAPVIGVAPNGMATIAWLLGGSTQTFLQAVTRPPGGVFSAPENLNNGKDNPFFTYEIAVADGGDAIVTWSGDNGGGQIVRAAVRPPGGSFGSPVAISQSSPESFHPVPAMDAAGNATVVWIRDNGTYNIVQAAGYDADPPELRGVSIPSTAKVGDQVSFSATSYDVWPSGAPSFSFGDGTQAAGSTVTHAYSSPGARTVTVTVADASGRTSAATGTILIKARNFFSFGKLVLNRKKGTATQIVDVPEPGSIVATGKGISKATVRTAKGGAVKVLLKAAGKARKRLAAKGKLKAKLKFTYSPVGGDPNRAGRRVTLKKKRG